jgi:hypothetical protein
MGDVYACRGMAFHSQEEATVAMERHVHGQMMRELSDVWRCVAGHWHFGVLAPER